MTTILRTREKKKITKSRKIPVYYLYPHYLLHMHIMDHLEEIFLGDGIGNHSGNGTLPKIHTMIKSEDKTYSSQRHWHF